MKMDIWMNIFIPNINFLSSKYFLQRLKLLTSGGISSVKVYYHDYWKKLYQWQLFSVLLGFIPLEEINFVPFKYSISAD